MHLKKGTQLLHISPGCQGTFPNHLLMSDYLVWLHTNIIHYKWDWDPITFLPHGDIEEMVEVLKHIGKLRLHQLDLSDLQYLSWTLSAAPVPPVPSLPEPPLACLEWPSMLPVLPSSSHSL